VISNSSFIFLAFSTLLITALLYVPHILAVVVPILLFCGLRRYTQTSWCSLRRSKDRYILSRSKFTSGLISFVNM
jgi:hypothetical protein